MSTTSELLATIERSMGVGRIQHPKSNDPILTLPSDHEAQSALAELRQRVADLEAFYQHMVSADLQNNHLEYLFDEMMEAGLRDPFEPHDETTAWAEYSALLDSLKS